MSFKKIKKYSNQLIVSVFIGLVLTFIIPYGIINYSLNKSIENYFEKIYEYDGEDYELSILHTDLKNNLDLIDSLIFQTRDTLSWICNASNPNDSKKLDEDNSRNTLKFKLIGSKPSNSKNPLFLGTIPKSNISMSNLEIFSDVLLPAYFPESQYECITNPTKFKSADKQFNIALRFDFSKKILGPLQKSMEIIRLNPAYKLRIYINGWIQFLTFWLFFTILVQLLLFHYRSSTFKYNEASELLKKIKNKKDKEQIKEAIKNQNAGDNIFVDLIRSPLLIFGLTSSYRNMLSIFRIQKEYFDEELFNEYDFIKDLVSFIALIGFIGTVLGILITLPESSKVFSSNENLVKQALTQEVTFKLGIAFDTTFVSLVLTIIILPIFKLISYSDSKRFGQFSSEVFELISTNYNLFKDIDIDDSEVFEQLLLIIDSKLQGVEDQRLIDFKKFLEEHTNQ